MDVNWQGLECQRLWKTLTNLTANKWCSI